MRVFFSDKDRWRKNATIFNTTSEIIIYRAWAWNSTVIKLSIFDVDITQVKNSIFVMYKHQYHVNKT